MSLPSRTGVVSPEARKAAVRALAERIYTASFAEYQGSDRACAVRAIEAAETFTLTWEARK